jgi:uncharacterized protein YbbK (DUF523 family)
LRDLEHFSVNNPLSCVLKPFNFSNSFHHKEGFNPLLGIINPMKLCSACLLGIKCRYNGKSALNKKVVKLLETETLVPVCPEQLGGLPTPREPAERRGNKVFTRSGKDVTMEFERGARQVLKIAKLLGIKEAILKQGSPSCGCGKIYNGSFSKKIIEGDGVTTALLKKNGIKIITEEEL